MPTRCVDCGASNPDWAEFCHRCGSRFSDEQMRSAEQRLMEPVCIRCGERLIEGGAFCTNCGSAQDQQAVSKITDEVLSRTFTAKFLAFIPGIFNIFGLGHIYLHSYVKALIFMSMSVIIYFGDYYLTEQGLMTDLWQAMILIFSLMVFLVQLWDIFRISNRMQGFA